MSKNVIEHDKLDKYEFTEVFDESERLHDTIVEGQKLLSTVDSLSEDVFYSLYKNIPKKHDSDVIEGAYRVNEELIDKVMRSKEYEMVRIGSKLDKMISALGTQSFVSSLLTEFSEDELNEMNEDAKKSRDYEQRLQSLNDQIEGHSDVNANPEIIKDLKEQLSKIQGEYQSHSESVDTKLNSKTSKLRTAVSNALKEAKETTDAVEGIMAGCGMSPAERQSLSWENKMEIANQLQNNSKLREIADMIGKMKRLAISVQKNKIRKVPEEVQSITQGDDLSHVLPSELLYADEPELDILFYKKYIDGELLQYELEGNDPEGKGAMIVCIDTSSSMSGTKEIWAKGIAMGMYNVARQQKRDFSVVLFSTDIQSFSIDKGEGIERNETVMRMLTSFLGGGTDFDKPLNKALELLDEGSDRADIVFITDGECRASEEIIQQLKRRDNLFIAGIGIGAIAGGLEDFANTTFMIGDILKEGHDTASELFQLV